MITLIEGMGLQVVGGGEGEGFLDRELHGRELRQPFGHQGYVDNANGGEGVKLVGLHAMSTFYLTMMVMKIMLIMMFMVAMIQFVS